METVLIIVATIIALFTVPRLVDRLFTRFTNPIVASALAVVSGMRAFRVAAKVSKETNWIFQMTDRGIREIGEALLLDGLSTREVNFMMFDLLEEKVILRSDIVLRSSPKAVIPGM